MTLAFKASSVKCTSAMDGEILQVCFDTRPESKEEEGRDTPYLLISQNFEFEESATVEWHDGTGYNGGAEILSITLTRDQASIELDRDLEIDVSFVIGDRRYAELRSYLRRMLDEGAFATT